jgi:hypothetical protein
VSRFLACWQLYQKNGTAVWFLFYMLIDLT